MNGPAALPQALLAVFSVILFFGLCGLIASGVAAFRRWRQLRRLSR